MMKNVKIRVEFLIKDFLAFFSNNQFHKNHFKEGGQISCVINILFESVKRAVIFFNIEPLNKDTNVNFKMKIV